MRSGVKKTAIMQRYCCSEWALTLIELDEPGLNACYRKAGKQSTQQGNRTRLEQYLAIRPTATRSDVMKALPGVYDALITKDKEWFYRQIPDKRVAAIKTRKERVDWAGTDRQKAAEVSSIFDRMLAPGVKPVQATETAVLKKAGLWTRYRNNPKKFPLVNKVLKKRSELYEQFLQRQVAWAVKQMASAGEPISINKLRRVAGVPAQLLRDRKDMVIKVSREMNAAINGRSFFA
ncbi:hypothetical protein GMLC_10440 [Geomonas limicola]|uniref:Transposon Tn7 transposition protein TnsD C-terminal domain-containing protein n=1 Tax=Geomonas limicola TaxID=2740186 RepID=A0A6V8N4J4_9BACT|nr:hypothetical protein GMLC_10440 [Geomonas limicola]